MGPRHRARLAPVGSAAKLFVHLCSADKKEKKIEIQTRGKKKEEAESKKGREQQPRSIDSSDSHTEKCREFFLQCLITEVFEKSCSLLSSLKVN